MKTEEKNNRKVKNFFLVLLKIFLIFFILMILIILIVGVIFAIYVDEKVEKEIDESLFRIVGSESATEIYYYEYSDRANRIGEAVKLDENELYGGYRSKYVDYKDIPQDLIDAFVSIEDKRFMEHKGVDWKRTLSAGANYFLKFSDSYGGSTITQQLIKNITDKDDYSFQRKIQEIFWALDLETKMDKREILTLYMNIINLSQGCYGVGAAAEYYFSKDLSELTLAECATIAAITNSPTYYDPIRNPEHNIERRNLILREMYEQEYISDDEYQSASTEELIIRLDEKYRSESVNSWYVDMVIEDVISDLGKEYGYSRPMANLVVYTGGLKIYTVMDKDVQNVLEDYYEDMSHFKISSVSDVPQSSMIIIDPYTGDILGVAGAVGVKEANRIQNYATGTLRPAGSAIKPLSVYAPALENGIIGWSSVYDDTPVNFGDYNLDESRGELVGPVAWPRNSNGIYRGLTNINYALAHSINTVTVKVLEDLGLEDSFDFLYSKCRIQSIIASDTLDSGEIITDKDYAALALGQFNYGVTVEEITAAYSAFVNKGVYSSTRSYYEVLGPDGEAVLENKYKGDTIISEETASLMTLMLENVVKSGTAKDIKLQKRVDCAGKTGSTQNNYDKWFIGYTPYYLGGVWYGYDYPKTIADPTGNRSIKIWDEVMTILHDKYISEDNIKSFDIDPDIVEYEYCTDSGKLLTDACRQDARGDRAEIGYCIKGSEPTSICPCHVLVDYDTVTGGVYISGCPNANIKKVGLISVERSFPMQIYITDAQYTWRDIGKEIVPQTSPSLPFYSNLLGENEYCGISNTTTQFNRACREHFNYFEWSKNRN